MSFLPLAAAVVGQRILHDTGLSHSVSLGYLAVESGAGRMIMIHKEVDGGTIMTIGYSPSYIAKVAFLQIGSEI